MIIKRRKICEKCSTGIDMYSLDSHAPMCPYVECIRKNKCAFYKPLKKSGGNVLKRIIILFKSGG